jgi:ferric-dicitrate binding protein FerR (iron transport regulator)
MTCRKARWLAAAAARGELSGRQEIELQQHLGSCEACRNAAGEADRLDVHLRTSLGHLPAVDLRPAVMRRLEEVTPPRRLPLPRWAAGATFAAAGAVTVLFGWALLRGPSSPRAGEAHVPAGPPAPVVAALQAPPGLVAIERAGGGSAPGAGGALRAGDRLRTPESTGAQLALTTGASVALDRGTTVELQSAGLALEAGRLKADVTPQSRDFVVQAGEAQVRVLGTSFAVEKRENGTTLVTVARGKVRLRNPLGETTVPAGTFAVARDGIPPLPAEPVDAEALLDWNDDLPAPQLVPADMAEEIDSARRAIAARRAELQALRRTLQRLRTEAEGSPQSAVSSRQ